MINLLPNENKIFFKKEYFRRFLIVSSIFAVIAIVTATIMILLTHRFLFEAKKNLNEQVAFSSEVLDELDAREILADINQLKDKLKVLEERRESTKLNANLKSVLELKTDGVSVKRIEYKRNTQNKKDEISLWGRALARENLIGYTDSLEEKFGKENVISPISNLLNKIDTDFMLKISMDYEK